jgi:putative transport protein
MMALFLTIALGYLLGEVNLKGFSLGVGAVLFVALFMGWLSPKSAPAPMVGTLGLALFLYAVGVQYGKQFFIGLTSPYGRRANLIALSGVLLAGVVSVLFMKLSNLQLGHALGLFAGAGTSTPTLQAAIVNLGNDDPAVGYSVAYPLGVAGPILFLYITFMLLKPKIEAPTGGGIEMLEIAPEESALKGKTIGDLLVGLPAGIEILALRRAHHNLPASHSMALAVNDVLLVSGPSREALEQAAGQLGEVHPGRVTSDRRDLDYLRVFASRAAVVGRALGDLKLPLGRPTRSSRCGAATPTFRRGPIWCWNSATASACSRIATTSPRCASSSAIRSKARPSSATSPSGSAWRWAFCSGPSTFRCRASASSRWACRAC